MKYLKMAEGAVGLFKTKVELVLESIDGKLLRTVKVEESVIPENFNQPFTIEVESRLWRVTGAKILREKSLLYSRKISLKVVEAGLYKDDSRSYVPTLAYPCPAGRWKDGEGDILFISKEEWRQFEFLPASMNSIMQEEFNAIEQILSPEVSPEPLIGFERVHYRSAVGSKVSEIPLKTFCSLLQQEITGKVMLDQQLISESFVIRTESNIYYGIYEADMIRDLCLYNYESVDDEFMLITSTFDLVLTDWCKATCYYIDQNAVTETPVSDQEDNIYII